MKFTLKKNRKESQYIGVYKTPIGKWYASQHINGVLLKSEEFDTEELAARAYDDIKLKNNSKSKLFNFHVPEVKEEPNKSLKRKRTDINTPNKKTKPTNSRKSSRRKVKKTKRVKFNQYFRNKVCSNQRWCCNICSKMFDDLFIVDHIRPLSLGGSNNIDNLQSLCPSCDKLKTGVIDYQIIKDLVKKDSNVSINKILLEQTKYFNKIQSKNVVRVINQETNDVMESQINSDARNITMSAFGVTFSVTVPGN